MTTPALTHDVSTLSKQALLKVEFTPTHSALRRPMSREISVHWTCKCDPLFGFSCSSAPESSDSQRVIVYMRPCCVSDGCYMSADRLRSLRLLFFLL